MRCAIALKLIKQMQLSEANEHYIMEGRICFSKILRQSGILLDFNVVLGPILT